MGTQDVHANLSNNLWGAGSFAETQTHTPPMGILAEWDCRSWVSAEVFLQGLLTLCWTQVVLLSAESAAFSLLTHYWPSLPSPYIFLEEAETITANFFSPLLRRF